VIGDGGVVGGGGTCTLGENLVGTTARETRESGLIVVSFGLGSQ